MGWECDNCGTVSTTPPCDECGHEHGEYTGFVWVCTECGKQSTRNNPPCVRCGNMGLEKRKPDYEDVESEAAGVGWLTVARPFAPLIAVMLLVAALFATGVVPFPLGDQTPTVENVPGNATTANGIDLAAVETNVHRQVNDFRAEQGESDLAEDETLAAMTTFANQQRVAEDYEGGQVRGGLGEFSPGCEPRGYFFGSVDGTDGSRIGDYETTQELADSVAQSLLTGSQSRQTVLDANTTYAVDVHVAPDGRIYVAHLFC
ncbi:hypothetical protein [Haloarchaeobius amylolyticus]|uniref:hypothetical protein n=1 Tax=Haloarchaeobius amylolyticus TaxID=1198296 RepID=UPI0022703EE2|nr:hypothetical protein [Haloarchaeobius amylolyticus]